MRASRAWPKKIRRFCMRAKALLPMLAVALMTAIAAAQNKPAPKAASGAQSSHLYAITPEDRDRANPVRLTDASVERGKKIFNSQCASCHGDKANGKSELA